MERKEVPLQDRWNVEALYRSTEEWDKDFNQWKGKEGTSRWPEIRQYQGGLKDAQTIKKLLSSYLEVDRHLNKLYTYAHLRHDEDVADTQHKEMYLKATALCHDFRKETSWIEPELVYLPEKDLQKLLQDPVLKEYRFYLEKIVRLKPHTLDANQEKLLASATFPLDSASRAFSAFNDGDIRFPKVKDEKGKSCELTHGKYLSYLRSSDQVLRRDSFQTFHKSYGSWENTLCELFYGQMQKHLFFAQARQFKSCLEAALFPHHIDPKVYLNLISTVRSHLPLLHQYFALRKKMLRLKELHLYDLHVPIIPKGEIEMGFDEAMQLVIEAVAPLGNEYQKTLRKGFIQERWADRYENDRKRSGAYSSGCYDSFPYILMNYQGKFHDMMTLSHEAGHSMHSYLSWKNQPYQDSAYPIFLAEVASTFHEELTLRHLLKTLTDRDRKAYLINQAIDGIRATFFRQVMFAEFELKMHESVEKGIPLTPAYLKQEYMKLNRDYFGPDVVIDEEVAFEWARIPHFYYNFYVYQYATGISAAHALVDLVLAEGPKRYLQFLSSGGNCFPLDALKKAGVDMTLPGAVKQTILHFQSLIEQLASIGK